MNNPKKTTTNTKTIHNQQQNINNTQKQHDPNKTTNKHKN